MISKATAKFIKSLQLKKFRLQHKAFLVEGAKSVVELLKSGHPVDKIIATDEFIHENKNILKGHELHTSTINELSVLGTLKTNNAAIAIAQIKEVSPPNWNDIPFALMLDDINDPGNLGTILRIADWYGINYIIASTTTTELYNPKVIASSKGSFLRVKVFYEDLSSFIEEYPKPLIGTFMEGESVHNFQWPSQGYLIMGSEANGISERVAENIKNKITIPGAGDTESLNVAVATAIVLDNWFRSVK